MVDDGDGFVDLGVFFLGKPVQGALHAAMSRRMRSISSSEGMT